MILSGVMTSSAIFLDVISPGAMSRGVMQHNVEEVRGLILDSLAERGQDYSWII